MKLHNPLHEEFVDNQDDRQEQPCNSMYTYKVLFVEQALVKDERKRATIGQLQQHPWLARFANRVSTPHVHITYAQCTFPCTQRHSGLLRALSLCI